jgi:hypothetical protein
MNLRTEARFWQVLGGVVLLGGFFLFVYTISAFGLFSTSSRAFHLGMAASFTILAGLVAFVAGRCLHSAEKHLRPLELFLWQIFGAAGIILGGAFVILLELKPPLVREERLVEGFAGSMDIVVGLVCLLGQRLMRHVQALGGHTESAPPAKAAAGD